MQSKKAWLYWQTFFMTIGVFAVGAIFLAAFGAPLGEPTPNPLINFLRELKGCILVPMGVSALGLMINPFRG